MLSKTENIFIEKTTAKITTTKELQEELMRPDPLVESVDCLPPVECVHIGNPKYVLEIKRAVFRPIGNCHVVK